MPTVITLDDLKSRYPAFVSKYGKKVNYSKFAFGEIFDENRKRKKELDDILGIDNTVGRLTIKSDIDVFKEFKYSMEIVGKLLKASGVEEEQLLDGSIMDNRRSSGEKFSRWLLKAIKDKTFVVDDFDQITKELPRFPVTYDLHLKSNAGSTDVFIQNLFSEIASSQKIMYISTEMFDILNAGNTSSFGSCFNLNSSMRNAPFTILYAPRVAMVYLSADGSTTKMSARAWLHFNEDFSEFYIHRKYGIATQAQYDMVCDYIKKRINAMPSKINAPDWERSNHVGVTHGGSTNATYFACESGQYYLDSEADTHWYDKGNGGTSVGFLVRVSDFPVCVKCGKENKYGYFCPECDKTLRRCSRCESYYDVDNPRISNTGICPDCANGKSDADSKEVIINAVKLCHACFGKKDGLRKVGKIWLCSDCISTLSAPTQKCGLCEKETSDVAIMFGKPLCRTCMGLLILRHSRGERIEYGNISDSQLQSVLNKYLLDNPHFKGL